MPDFAAGAESRPPRSLVAALLAVNRQLMALVAALLAANRPLMALVGALLAANPELMSPLAATDGENLRWVNLQTRLAVLGSLPLRRFG